MLNAEETIFYLRKAKAGDGNAKETLLNNNVLLIKSIVKRFTNKGVEYDDLYQLGCMGFLKAIKNFDEKFGVVFSTYAVPMIIGEIKRFLRDDGAIKVSRIIKSQAQTINRFIQAKTANGDDAPPRNFTLRTTPASLNSPVLFSNPTIFRLSPAIFTLPPSSSFSFISRSLKDITSPTPLAISDFLYSMQKFGITLSIKKPHIKIL